MYLAGNANLTHEDDARAENDAVATKSWGSGKYSPKILCQKFDQKLTKNGENLDPYFLIAGPGLRVRVQKILIDRVQVRVRKFLDLMGSSGGRALLKDKTLITMALLYLHDDLTIITFQLIFILTSI